MSNLADPASFVLFTYESISGIARVRVRAKYLTERESARHEQLWQDVKPFNVDDPKAIELRNEMLKIGILSPSIDELTEKLSRRDLMQLAYQYPQVIDNAEYELLGKSRSRPQFIMEPSADDAAPAPAITTPPTPAPPPPENAPSK